MPTDRGSPIPAGTDPPIRDSAEDVDPEGFVSVESTDGYDLDSVDHRVDSAESVRPLTDRPPWFGTDRGPSASQLANWAKQHVYGEAPR